MQSDVEPAIPPIPASEYVLLPDHVIITDAPSGV